MKIKTPEYKSGYYERYRIELEAWQEITDLEAEKQGIAIALTLPEDDESGIREKVFDELSITDLKGQDGLDKLLTFMDKKLKKDDLADSWEKFSTFEEYEKKEQSITEYISKFDQNYNKMSKKGMTLPSEILAFKLLKQANLGNEERLLVLTGMDYKNKKELYEQAKLSLKKFKGDQVSEISNGVKAANLETVCLTEEEVLHTNHRQQNNNGRRGRGSYRGGAHRGGANRGAYRGGARTRPQQNWQQQESDSSRPSRKINPKNSEGKLLTCASCGSYRHLLPECPDSWENLAKTNKNNSQEFCLYTGADTSKPDNALLRSQAAFCAVLDCACSSTVCGTSWFQNYTQMLNDEEKKKIKQFTGGRLFKFGGGEVLSSIACYEIPAYLAGKEITIITDVVDSDIPLLLSIKAMKKAGIILDLVNDSAEIFGKVVSLNHTSSGHYCVSIAKEFDVSQVFAVKIAELEDSDRYKVLLKLHRQFAHPSMVKLISLLKDSNSWSDEFKPLLLEIYQRCELCKMYPTTPPRPAVALPLAAQFNDKVALDLKKWGDKWILHMIDMWSRLTVSKFISRKKPTEVIDNIMLHWCGAGYGIMSNIVTDNGGEFNADEIREVSSILNIQTITTAAESPFQNGLCERNHAITDIMLLKLKEQCPRTPIDVLLAWANTSRNSLQMWHGFSSYQLVFGKNPNVPNVMTDNIAALQGTTSETLATHLNALHASRKAFIESESSERIRRALYSKIRVSEQIFNNGDRVFYMREGSKKWLGPAKVVFQDGKVIFIRHGGIMVRVSPNRLIKAPEDPTLTPMENSAKSRGEEFEQPIQTPINHKPLVEVLSKHDGSRSKTFTEEDVGINKRTARGDNDPPNPDESKRPATPTTRQGPSLSASPTVNDAISVQSSFQKEATSSQQSPIISSKDSTSKRSSRNSSITAPSPKDSTRQTVKFGDSSLETSTSKTKQTAKNQTFPKKGETISIKQSSEWKSAKVISRAGKANGKFKSWFNLESSEDQSPMAIDLDKCEWKQIPDAPEEVNIVIIPKNQQQTPDCERAKLEEIEKLKQFNTFSVVKDEGQFRISTTWVLWEKNGGVRARLVARGYEESFKERTDSPTVSKNVLRTFLAIAPNTNWNVKTTDIKSAFLQGKTISREIHVSPPKETELKGKLWKLQKCLYGLNDAARQFYASVADELTKQGCIQSILDPAVFYYKLNDSLQGFIVCHVDDFLHAGNNRFETDIIKPLHQRFHAGRCEEETFNYVGFHLTQTSDGITISQNDYVQSLPDVEISPERMSQKCEKLTPEETTTFRALVGKLNWAVQGSRPDFAFHVVYFSTKFNGATVNDLIQLKKCIRKLKESSCEVMFPTLGHPGSWGITVFSDAAHANLNGVNSTSGHIVFLTGENGRCASLSWSCNKIKRVVRSSLAAEALSLQEGLEDGFYHQSMIQELFGKNCTTNIKAYTDSKSLIEAINSTKLVDDKRLRIDIGAIKESIQKHEADVRWCPGSKQLANCLTKKGAQSNDLLRVIQTGRLD